MQMQATKLCHSGDPDTSFDAAERLIKSGELTRQEKAVCEAILTYEALRATGMLDIALATPGFTAKELAAQSGLDYYMISRRLSALKDKAIERTMFRRNHSAVWRLKNENG
jgi:hypothetical protein